VGIEGSIDFRDAPPNKRLERTRLERASLVSCVGEPLKRNVSWLRIAKALSVSIGLQLV
jgi:hypothetical protein